MQTFNLLRRTQIMVGTVASLEEFLAYVEKRDGNQPEFL